MMYAIYYTDPETGDRLPCTSGRQMEFGQPDEEPALYAQSDNAHKVLRDYARSAIGHHLLGTGWGTYLASGPRVKTNNGYRSRPMPGRDDPSLSCFSVVPMAVTPVFENAEPASPIKAKR